LLVSFSPLFVRGTAGLFVVEMLVEALAAPVVDISFIPEIPSISPPVNVEVGPETARLEKALVPLMPALRGLMIETDPDIREFYEWHLEVQRHDVVVMRGMGNGFFRTLCFEGQRRLRAEYGRPITKAE
jgi:hypothetical protein